jgi:hypothetical protein
MFILLYQKRRVCGSVYEDFTERRFVGALVLKKVPILG